MVLAIINSPVKTGALTCLAPGGRWVDFAVLQTFSGGEKNDSAAGKAGIVVPESGKAMEIRRYRWVVAKMDCCFAELRGPAETILQKCKSPFCKRETGEVFFTGEEG